MPFYSVNQDFYKWDIANVLFQYTVFAKCLQNKTLEMSHTSPYMKVQLNRNMRLYSFLQQRWDKLRENKCSCAKKIVVVACFWIYRSVEKGFLCPAKNFLFISSLCFCPSRLCVAVCRPTVKVFRWRLDLIISYIVTN